MGIAASSRAGREALKPAEVRGWSKIAQLIRDHAQYLTSRIDQEFPGPRPNGALSYLCSSVRRRRRPKAPTDSRERRGASFELFYSGTHDDKERAEQAVRDGASFFFGACEWVQGSVERLDDREEFARSIAKQLNATVRQLPTSSAQHVTYMRRRGRAETLLAAAAPDPDDLEQSTIGRRDASLRDIARSDSFALAARTMKTRSTDGCAEFRPHSARSTKQSWTAARK